MLLVEHDERMRDRREDFLGVSRHIDPLLRRALGRVDVHQCDQRAVERALRARIRTRGQRVPAVVEREDLFGDRRDALETPHERTIELDSAEPGPEGFDIPSDVGGSKLEQLGRRVRVVAQAAGGVDEEDGISHRAKNVDQVAVASRQVRKAPLQLVVDRRQLLVGRLELLLGTFELLVGALQLLVR